MERDLMPKTWQIDLGGRDIIQSDFSSECDDIASEVANSTSQTAPLVAPDSTPAKEELDTDDEEPDKVTASFCRENQDVFIQLLRELEGLEGRLSREVDDMMRVEQMLKNCRPEGAENIRNVKNMLFDLSIDILESSSKQHMIKNAKEDILYVFTRAMNQDKYETTIDDQVEDIVRKSLKSIVTALGCSDSEDSDFDPQDEVTGDQEESADEDTEDLGVSDNKGKSENKNESGDKTKSEYKKEPNDKGKSEYKKESDGVEWNGKKQSGVRDDSKNRSDSEDIVESSDIAEYSVLAECSDSLESSDMMGSPDIVESSLVVECSDAAESSDAESEGSKHELLLLIIDDEVSDLEEESEHDNRTDSENDSGDDEASADDETKCF